jgi:copper chaperone CopZ
MARYAFFDFVDDIAVHFLIGVLIAAAITLILPTNFFADIAIGSGIIGMLVMLIIGFPMYICSTSSIPIALALMAKGISPGAAFVFLFAGPATNAASLSVLIKTLGKKTVAAYLAVMAVCAVGFGLLLDALIAAFEWDVVPIGDAMAGHGASVLEIIAGIVFGLLLLRSLIKKLAARIKARRAHRVQADAVLNVKGMTCGHCSANVQHALEGVSGVRKAVADEKKGTALVFGQGLSTDALCAAVKAAGYDAEPQKGEI